MTQSLALTAKPVNMAVDTSNDLLTVQINDQLFGIPILQVHDVLGSQSVTPVPLAPPEVAGSLNLRGRIVTAIKVRRRLCLPPAPPDIHEMSIVVEFEEELYSLIFDTVGDVLSLDLKDFESNPSTLDPQFRSVADGIYRLQDRLLVVLDVPKMLRGIGNDLA